MFVSIEIDTVDFFIVGVFFFFLLPQFACYVPPSTASIIWLGMTFLLNQYLGVLLTKWWFIYFLLLLLPQSGGRVNLFPRVWWHLATHVPTLVDILTPVTLKLPINRMQPLLYKCLLIIIIWRINQPQLT